MYSLSGRQFVHPVLIGMFLMHLCKQSTRRKDVFPSTYITNLQVQTVFLMMNIRCSKHAEDTKN